MEQKVLEGLLNKILVDVQIGLTELARLQKGMFELRGEMAGLGKELVQLEKKIDTQKRRLKRVKKQGRSESE